MGKARLYMYAKELEKSIFHARQSVAILERSQYAAPPRNHASLLMQSGEIESAYGNNAVALDAYNQSLNLFQEYDIEAKEVFDIHTKLVEVNHKLGREKETVFHCIQGTLAQIGSRKMRAFMSQPIYDPEERLTTKNRNGKRGKIRASYRKGLDCRLHDIEIHQTIGISHLNAMKLLKQAYFPPLVMNGKLTNGEYTTLANLIVYDATREE